MLIGAPGLEGGPRGWIAAGLVLGLAEVPAQPLPVARTSSSAAALPRDLPWDPELP